MKFDNGKELLDYLKTGKDLYSPEKELYMFLYNEAGSICVYEVDKDEARDVSRLSLEKDEYWAAFLSSGGLIYDDVFYDSYSKDQTSNLDYCEQMFSGEWNETKEYGLSLENEELNTKLYEKMFAEQEKYRDWMMKQPPNEILHYCYDYVIREDILLSLEMNDLTTEQCKALLKSPSPLYDVYRDFEKRESEHMQDILDTIENRANDVILMAKEKAERESR